MPAFQTDRILRKLEQTGWVSPIDFAAPNVWDGGDPIMRVAARIADLRDQGYELVASRAKNGTAVYHLDRGMDATTGTDADPGTDAHQLPSATPPADGSTLFDLEPVAGSRPHYQEAA